MAFEDAKPLYDYVEPIGLFITLIRAASENNIHIWKTPELTVQCEEILKQLRTRRGAALNASLKAGASFDSIHNTLNMCERQIESHHKTTENSNGAHGPKIAFEGTFNSLMACQNELRDYIFVLESFSGNDTKKGASTGPKIGINDERDRWLYEELCKTGENERTLESIRNELNRRKGWRKIGSVQGIRQAALRFQRRNQLPAIPRRKQD